MQQKVSLFWCRPSRDPFGIYNCVCLCVCDCVFIATIHNYRKSFEHQRRRSKEGRAKEVQRKQQNWMPRGSYWAIERVSARPRAEEQIAGVCEKQCCQLGYFTVRSRFFSNSNRSKQIVKCQMAFDSLFLCF